MLKTFHEHTLDTDFLKPGCVVLDVGCRGFAFGNALRAHYQARVYELDIDDLGPVPYYRCGIAASDGFGSVTADEEPEARHLTEGNAVPIYTLESFSQRVGVPFWDVIKLDCEGSEYDILWNLSKPPATQITVEFHQHTAARHSQEFMDALIEKMSKWYWVKNHKLQGQTLAAKNYWDSVFVLRNDL